MISSATLITLSVLSYTSVCFVNAQSRCFWPDGTPSPDYPCKPAASASACCGMGWDCLSNGLCFHTNIALTRSSCTDKTWSTNECPTICAFSEHTYGNLVECGIGSTVGDAGTALSSYCCNDDNSCNCTSGENVVILAPNPATITSLTLPSTSPTSSTSLAPSASTSNATPTTPLPSATAMPSSNHYIAIGVGLSVPLGLAILGVIAFLLFKIRRLEKRAVIQPDVSTQTHQSVISHIRQPSLAEMRQPSGLEWYELDGVGEAVPALCEVGESLVTR